MRRRREMQFGAGKGLEKGWKSATKPCTVLFNVLCKALCCFIVNTGWCTLSALFAGEKLVLRNRSLCWKGSPRYLQGRSLFTLGSSLCLCVEYIEGKTSIKLSQSHCYCLEQWWLSGCNWPLYLLWWKCWGVNWRNWLCRIRVPVASMYETVWLFPCSDFSSLLLSYSSQVSIFHSFAVSQFCHSPTHIKVLKHNLKLPWWNFSDQTIFTCGRSSVSIFISFTQFFRFLCSWRRVFWSQTDRKLYFWHF